MQLNVPTAAAEPLFHVGIFPVTNSMVNGWIAVVFFVIIALLLQRRLTMVPKGLQNVAEGIVDFILRETQKVTGDLERARKFFPIVATIFLFILFSNWIGLFPGTGSIGVWAIHEGERTLIPLLRPAASDVNLTLAMAAFAVITSHVMGFASVGFANHVSKFFNVRGIVRSFTKGPMAILVAVIEFGVGLIEIVSEFAKVISLSLRLFGNVFAGEVLMTVMLGLFSFFLPIPFIFLEILVGAVQATVFAMLTLAYLTVATSSHEEQEEEHALENVAEAHV
jgi:F-type H+-transporting ATPase subunit a